jgi:hypothetical protein
MPTVIQDKFENIVAYEHLSRLLTVVRHNLVPIGVGDYFWHDADGLKISLEHKTGEEAASESGNRLDGQLEKHIRNADLVGLIISDMITPTPEGSIQVWKRKYNRVIKKFDDAFVRGRTVDKEYSAFEAYIFSLERLGVPVFRVPDLESMAHTIASFVYNSTNKRAKDHTTLRKHLRPRVTTTLAMPDGIDKGYVETLMGIRKARIGEKTALKLIQEFETPHKVLTASVESLRRVIGKGTAENLLDSIGRKHL